MIYNDFYGPRNNNITVRDEVTRRYIRPEHVQRIEDHFRNVTSLHFFSVRPAGLDTLDKLAMGAAPKPHSILEKSIKADEYDFLYYLWHDPTNEALAPYEQEAKNTLYGLVPYRNDFEFEFSKSGRQEKGKIRYIGGLYLSSAGERHFRECPGFQINQDKHNRAYVVFDASLDLLDWVHQIRDSAGPNENFAQWFVTGDYDLHDLVEQVGSSIAPYVSDSGDEATALTQLGNIISGKIAGGPVRSFRPEEWSLIQHGPQYNYVAHTFDKERETEIVGKVADLSLDIALYDGHSWTIIQNNPNSKNAFENQSAELKTYYTSHNAILKWTWDRSNPAAEAYITDISGKNLADLVREQIRKALIQRA